MKNIRKIAAMIMAVAMLIGLMVVSASAASSAS